MVSSFALHYKNERTLRELLRPPPGGAPGLDPALGHDAEVMRSGAEIAAAAGADLIDINMGCPVPKVRKTGAGQLLRDPDLAIALAVAAREGSGLPVTVKLRSGISPRGPLRLRPGDPPCRGGGRQRRSASTRAPRPKVTKAARLRPDPRTDRALWSPGDRLRRPLQRRGGPPRRPGVGRRRGRRYRPRQPRQPLGLRGTHGPPRGAAEPGRPRRRAALGDRPRRGAPGGRARSLEDICGKFSPTRGTSKVSAPPTRSATNSSAPPTWPAPGSLSSARADACSGRAEQAGLPG